MSNGTIKRVAFAGLIALGSIQVGCIEDTEPDDVGSDQYASSGSGSGPVNDGNCDNPVYGNQMYWNGSVAALGGYCDTSCVGSGSLVRYDKHELVATKYTVANTCSQGKHTGVGFTTRNKAHWWYTSVGPVLHETQGNWYGFSIGTVYNHGRGVDPNAYNVNSTLVVSGTTALRAAVSQCVDTAATDGFCDRMCGNDAYTLPPAALSSSELDPNTNWFLNAQLIFSNRMTYGNKHWAKGTALAEAGLIICDETSNPGGIKAFPKYGHNSNTDANAQKAMFGRCSSVYSTLKNSCDLSASNVKNVINGHVISVCHDVCGGFRRKWWSESAHYSKDLAVGNKALSDSSLSGASSSATSSGGQPSAGDVLDGSWGYSVQGM